MILGFEELKALVELNRLGHRKRVVDMLAQGMEPVGVLERLRAERLDDQSPFEFDAEREIEKVDRLGFSLMTWKDKDYPENLRQIPDPPLVLYMAGTIEAADESAVAIVGTRHPSFYGVEQAGRFAMELAQSGITIISGFAKGIDCEAHEGALQIHYGRTIAVLGCGLDVSYPRGQEKLFAKIRERGAVISEYALGTEPRAENFPRRNRIISGLSLGVLVVEAHLISGSLITAHEAIDQGREVFAIPGPINKLTSKGTHRLIKEGAALVESPQEILEHLYLPISAASDSQEKNTPRQNPPRQAMLALLNQNEEEILNTLKAGAFTCDDIVKNSNLAPGIVMAALTKLEILKKIQKERGGQYSLPSDDSHSRWTSDCHQSP